MTGKLERVLTEIPIVVKENDFIVKDGIGTFHIEDEYNFLLKYGKAEEKQNSTEIYRTSLSVEKTDVMFGGMKIELGGQEIKGVRKMDFSAEAGEVPTVTLECYCADGIEVDGVDVVAFVKDARKMDEALAFNVYNVEYTNKDSVVKSVKVTAKDESMAKRHAVALIGGELRKIEKVVELERYFS